MQNSRIYTLMASVCLESLFSQIIFIYIPLMFLFSQRSEVETSFVRSLAYIAPVLLGYYIGTLVDTYDKRKSGFISALLISIVSTVFAFFGLYNNFVATVFYLFFISILTYYLANLRFTILPVILRDGDLPKANSFLLIIDNASVLIAPLVASLLLKASSPKNGLFFISFALFISSFLYLYSLKSLAYTLCSQGKKSRLTFSETWRIFSNCKQLVVVVIATMGNNAFVGIFSLYIIIVAFKSSLLSEVEAPLLFIASGIGAIVAGVMNSKVFRNVNVNFLVLFCCISLALCGLLPVYFQSKFIFYLSSFSEGFFSSVLVITVWTLRQKLVPSEISGRVTGITSSLFKLSPVVCLPAAGLISDSFGPNLALLSSIFWILFFSAPLIWYLFVMLKSRGVAA